MTRKPLRLLIDIIDWGYPEQREQFRPQVYDLADRGEVEKMALGFGNGIFNELRAEAETQEALDVLRGLALGVGSCQPVELSEEEKARLWFYQPGDECLRQGSAPNGAVIMLDPVLRPQRFP